MRNYILLGYFTLIALVTLPSVDGQGHPSCFEVDIDFYGNDIAFIGNISATDCACKCKRRAGCNFFTWRSSDLLCNLKSSDEGRKGSSGALSASVDCYKKCEEGHPSCVEEDIDFYGNDIGYVGNVGSATECTCKCKAKAGCNFFTWNSRNSLCILKTSDEGRKGYTGGFSASVDCLECKEGVQQTTTTTRATSTTPPPTTTTPPPDTTTFFELSCNHDKSICYVSGSLVPIVTELASDSPEPHDVRCCGGVSGNTTTTTCGNGTSCTNVCGSYNSGCLTVICDECHTSSADHQVCDTPMQEEQWCANVKTIQGITNQCGTLKKKRSIRISRAALGITTTILNINYCPRRCRSKSHLPRMKLCCLHPYVRRNVKGVIRDCCVNHGLCF